MDKKFRYETYFEEEGTLQGMLQYLGKNGVPISSLEIRRNEDYWKERKPTYTMTLETQTNQSDATNLRADLNLIRGYGYHSPEEIKKISPSSIMGPEVRVANCLEASRISTVGTLASMTSKELMRVKGFGKTALAKVKRTLDVLGIEHNLE